ncbi:hypothetical protein EST38_g10158 [Candolleomyces aberdarensis]|uniref:Reverse transcriptase domain-containing protein n=1 Tax=Candolleomyces aberdarensis TaxID=2316362 RepID=A0A4Q2DAJ6_9AGAR|nr:hypothetical protein EST38_g10158 [Candolleomyces aberdarensis]
MPFGLSDAPSVFQTFIQDTLCDFIGVFCVVYLDDILIFSSTQEEHDEQVKLVLDCLKDVHLFANPKKCKFDKSKVEYLGYLIGTDGIKMNPKKLATISKWPVPCSSHDVQVFLGFCNFYQRFVDHYADIALPLHALTRKIFLLFGHTEHNAFEKLKCAFTSYPVLCHYDTSKPATLVTDASDFALSDILQQTDDAGHLHPVAFHSQKFSPAEIHYSIHDKELLAIVDSFRNMHTWLMGTVQTISVACDHHNLKYFMKTQPLNRCQSRWSMLLTEYNFQLNWIPGTQNPADGPSLCPDFFPKKGDDVLNVTQKTLLSPYHLSRIYPKFKSKILSTSIPTLTTLSIDNSELLKRFQDTFHADTEWCEAILCGNSNFTALNNIVFHNGCVFVPQPLHAEILYQCHDFVLSGHPGCTLTVKNVMCDFSWPGIYTYVCHYVSASITQAGSTRPVITMDSVTPAITQADITKWETNEMKARTRLELVISDSEMAHIIGANLALEIWERLCQIKESKGRLGVLATRRALYCSQVQGGFDMAEHIANLRSLQAELALMSNVVTDEDFVMILIALLPES